MANPATSIISTHPRAPYSVAQPIQANSDQIEDAPEFRQFIDAAEDYSEDDDAQRNLYVLFNTNNSFTERLLNQAKENITNPDGGDFSSAIKHLFWIAKAFTNKDGEHFGIGKSALNLMRWRLNSPRRNYEQVKLETKFRLSQVDSPAAHQIASSIEYTAPSREEISEMSKAFQATS